MSQSTSWEPQAPSDHKRNIALVPTVHHTHQIHRAAGIYSRKPPQPYEYSDEYQLSLNEKIFGPALACGSCVETLYLCPQSARQVTNFFIKNWKEDGLKMPVEGVHVVARGFDGYGLVHAPMKKGRSQSKDTALLEPNVTWNSISGKWEQRDGLPNLLQVTRLVMPGFEELETQVLAKVQQHPCACGRKPYTVSANALRQRGEDTNGTSNFANHLDTWSFEDMPTPALTIVIKTTEGIPSKMGVLGAREHYAYPDIAGAAALFPSGCAHSSIPTVIDRDHDRRIRSRKNSFVYKLVFFVSFLDWNEDVELPHYAYFARSIFNVPAVQEQVEELLENKECEECEELLYWVSNVFE